MAGSTVQMARHYTDGLVTEDRRAAEHIGRLLAGKPSKVSKGSRKPA